MACRRDDQSRPSRFEKTRSEGREGGSRRRSIAKRFEVLHHHHHASLFVQTFCGVLDGVSVRLTRFRHILYVYVSLATLTRCLRQRPPGGLRSYFPNLSTVAYFQQRIPISGNARPFRVIGALACSRAVDRDDENYERYGFIVSWARGKAEGEKNSVDLLLSPYKRGFLFPSSKVST